MNVYKISPIKELIGGNPYVGRGIIIGKTPDGDKAAVSYFIMGRSANSRNRIFNQIGNELYTEPFDVSKVGDPSLIIYAPVRVLAERTIVTNGDQTDTIYDTMADGGSFSRALRTRTFEPDAPNYTPRISGYVKVFGGRMRVRMSVLKSDDGNPDSVERFFFEYPAEAGLGHFIHTYKCDGNPIPSFEGEPTPVAVEANAIDEWTDIIWSNLNEDNKVSLFTRFINLETGEEETRIVNKNK